MDCLLTRCLCVWLQHIRFLPSQINVFSSWTHLTHTPWNIQNRNPTTLNCHSSYLYIEIYNPDNIFMYLIYSPSALYATHTHVPSCNVIINVSFIFINNINLTYICWISPICQALCEKCEELNMNKTPSLSQGIERPVE